MSAQWPCSWGTEDKFDGTYNVHPVAVVGDAVPTTPLLNTACEDEVGDGDGDVGHSCVGGRQAGFKFCRLSGLRGDQPGAATYAVECNSCTEPYGSARCSSIWR